MTTTHFITKEQALNIALTYAGIENNEPHCLSNVFRSGFYQVAVWTPYLKYEFFVDAVSGDVAGIAISEIGEDGKRMCSSVRFGADEYVYHGEPFRGARLDALCGGLRLDMRQALISEDEEIDIHTFLGGVEILVPANVNVIVNSHDFLGGVSDETVKSPDLASRTIHITASNFLGGVSIKHQ